MEIEGRNLEKRRKRKKKRLRDPSRIPNSTNEGYT
jgi:hypothetical protein